MRKSRRFDTGAVIAYSIAVAMPSSSQTVVIPAFPELIRHHGWSASSLAWLVSAFLVTASIAAPLFGRTGDLKGRRRLITATAAFYFAGSAICLVDVGSVPLVILGRGLQGLSAGVFVLQIATAQELLPATRRAVTIGLLSGIVGIGPALGFLGGGFLTSTFGVEAIFITGMAVSGVTTVVLWLLGPASGGRATGSVDSFGAALLAVWFVGLLSTLALGGSVGWSSWATIGVAVASVCTFLAWLRYQWSSSSPLVDLRTLRLPEIRLGNAATVANACAAFGLFLAVPQLLQSSPDEAGYGLSPIGVGAVLAPAAAVMAIVGPLAGWMGSRVGHHVPAVIGNLVCAGGLGAMTFWHGSMSAVLAWFIVSAVGLGLTFPALPSLVMGAVPQSDAGAAAGLNSLSRGIGSAVGAQIAAALLFVQVASSPGAAFPRTFMASALFALVAAAFVAAVPRRRRV